MEFNAKYHTEVMHEWEHLGIVLQVQTDPRKVMRAAYTSFRDGVDPETILDAVGPQPNSHDLFYARLVCPQLSIGSYLNPETFPDLTYPLHPQYGKAFC
jgi:hypothetical protein